MLLIFFPFTIIGWIWAIIYGVQIYQVSTDHARKNAGGNYMAIRAPMMGQPQGPYMVAAPGGAYNMALINQGGAPHQMQYMQQQQMQYVQQQQPGFPPAHQFQPSQNMLQGTPQVYPTQQQFQASTMQHQLAAQQPQFSVQQPQVMQPPTGFAVDQNPQMVSYPPAHGQQPQQFP